MLRFNVKAAKGQFFDRLKVIEALDAVALKGLSKFGAFVRRTARSSMRKARRKRESELSPKERVLWNIRARVARAEGRPEPPRPYQHSKPGEPPRTIVGLVKRHLYFAYDAEARSVVIGPARLSKTTNPLRTLEEGGTVRTNKGSVRVDARPYMRPAFHKDLPQLPRLLKGAA